MSFEPVTLRLILNALWPSGSSGFYNPLLNNVPLTRFDKLPLAKRNTLEEEFGRGLFSIEPGILRARNRFQRVPHLAQGQYSVALDETKCDLPYLGVDVPATTVKVSHYRTSIPRAKFNPERRWTPDPYQIEVNDETGGVETLVNAEFVGGDFSTHFSDFDLIMDTPEGWHETQQAFEKWSHQSFQPSLRGAISK